MTSLLALRVKLIRYLGFDYISFSNVLITYYY